MRVNIIRSYETFFKFIKKFDGDIILYGAGAWGKLTFNILKYFDIKISFFCDSNKQKVGNNFLGKKIISIDELETFSNCVVIICIKSETERERIVSVLGNMKIDNIVNLSVPDISLKPNDKISHISKSDYEIYTILSDDYSKKLFRIWLYYILSNNEQALSKMKDRNFDDTLLLDSKNNFSVVSVKQEEIKKLKEIIIKLYKNGYKNISLYKQERNFVVKGDIV